MAGKKRKAEAARLEETDRALYGAFRGAANSLSQLYTLGMGAQKASFHAGERHAMEKLYEWILRQHENGLRLTVADVASHIQVSLQSFLDMFLYKLTIQTQVKNLHILPFHRSWLVLNCVLLTCCLNEQ
ncbi:Uncharacterized conserved protein UCP009193 [Zea mays]|uniref:Uncharacterized conserved protein UCP009193 n=1 Tax=Zea mays TaxID=4577 RepID=A0A1D6EPA1_MAIZE|nr:Uncharacterized conserved protein UCP009193 [Zea mays]